SKPEEGSTGSDSSAGGKPILPGRPAFRPGAVRRDALESRAMTGRAHDLRRRGRRRGCVAAIAALLAVLASACGDAHQSSAGIGRAAHRTIGLRTLQLVDATR